MKKFKTILWRAIYASAAIAFVFSFGGCLTGEKLSYTVYLNPDLKGGKAEIIFYDIHSDYGSEQELKDDIYYLFNYMWKSQDLIRDYEAVGKYVKERELYIEDGKLNGRIIFEFKRLQDFENLRLEENYLYLTFEKNDKVISTNGEYIESEEYNRIIWDSSERVLKFEMGLYKSRQAKSLAPYFLELKNK